MKRPQKKVYQFIFLSEIYEDIHFHSCPMLDNINPFFSVYVRNGIHWCETICPSLISSESEHFVRYLLIICVWSLSHRFQVFIDHLCKPSHTLRFHQLSPFCLLSLILCEKFKSVSKSSVCILYIIYYIIQYICIYICVIDNILFGNYFTGI